MVDETKRKSIERKIEHLLRIAERATGPEAETAMLHARRLMLEWNVTEADLGHQEGYVRRTVWTGRAHPVWYDYVMHLCHHYFFARGVMTQRWQNDNPTDPPYSVPGKWLHGTDLFASQGNIAVACYAFAVLSREFRDQLRQHKPQAKRAFCLGVARTLDMKFHDDQRGWAARDESRALILSPRSLHDKVDEALARQLPELKEAPLAKRASVDDRFAQAAGERAVKDFVFSRPLPGNEPATLALPGQSR